MACSASASTVDFNRNHNWFDNMTWMKGRHTLQFGFTYHRYQKQENDAGANPVMYGLRWTCYGQPFDASRPRSITLAPLPLGVYQLTVHLGFDDDELRGATGDHPDWGAARRQNDFDLVRSPEFQHFLRAQGFILVS